MTEDSVTRFERLQRERWEADRIRRAKRDRKRMPKWQNYYLARWRQDSTFLRPGVSSWVPDVPDLDGRWSCIDLRPDISVADGWCIINHMSDVSWTEGPGLIKLANNPQDSGNAPRVVFNNRLGVETGANKTLGERVMTVLLEGDDGDPGKWNRLKANGNFEVHCGVLMHEMPRIRGGAVLDNFNRTNEGPPPSSSWSEVTPSGYGGYGTNWAVSSSTIARAAGDDWLVRWDSDVGAGDHWFSADVVDIDHPAALDEFFGIWARANSTTDDASGYYYLGRQDDSHQTYKSTSAGIGESGGSTLSSDDTSGETIIGSTMKIQCDGSTISAELDDTEYHSDTDSTYTATGRARGGLYVWTGSGGAWVDVDNFSGAGLVIEADPAPTWTANSDWVVTGEKINVVAPTPTWEADSDWVASTFLPVDWVSDDTDVTMTGQKVATASISFFTNTNWKSELEAPALTPRPVIETVKMFAPSDEFKEMLR